MSSQNPNPRQRRRIAGERQGARPASPPEASAHPGAESDQPTASAAPRSGPTKAGTSRPTSDAKPQRGAKPSRGPVSRVPGRILVALGLAAAVLVAFAASGFGIDGMGVQAWRTVDEESQVEDATRSAPAAAERAAAAILAYDHETLEADRDNAARFMTDDYRKEYLDTFGLVLDNAPELEAVVQAEVKASGVSHADPSRANVLLFVDQTTRSKANDEPQTALNRVMFTMAEEDGTWLVDDITSY